MRAANDLSFEGRLSLVEMHADGCLVDSSVLKLDCRAGDAKALKGPFRLILAVRQSTFLVFKGAAIGGCSDCPLKRV